MELILTNLNGFGKYQKIILILIGLISFLCAFLLFSPVFTAAQPKLTCKYLADQTVLPNSCEAWKALKTKSEQLRDNNSYTCDFEDQYYGQTIVTEWSLYCDRLYLASTVTTSFMIGTMFSFIGGWIGDNYGRRLSCLVSLAGIFVPSAISEIAITKFSFDWYTNYLIYTTAQFFIGFWSTSLFFSAMILLCEFTSVKYHTLVNTMNLYLYVVGELLMAVFYYFARDFHNVNIFVCVFSAVLLLLMLLLLPESPRFLIANKSYEECYKILKKISRVNGTTDQMFTRERFFKQIEANENGTVGHAKNEINFHEIQSLLSIRNKYYKSQVLDETEEKEMPFKSTNDLEIIQNKSLFFFLMNPIKNLLMTLLMGLFWVFLSLVYYGFSYGITLISEDFNPYLIFTLSCIAEASGYALSLLDSKFPAKRVMLMFLWSAAFFSALVILFPRDTGDEHTWRSYLLIADATLGKMAVSAAYNSGYGYTYKMFPASIRNTMFTVCLSIGKLGPMLAPTVIMLQAVVFKSFPYMVFTTCAMLASVFLLILPDPSSNIN